MSLVVPATLRRWGRTETLTRPQHTSDYERIPRGSQQPEGCNTESRRMRNLNFELKMMCRRNRDGIYATQRDRERVLDLVANQLHELGYRHMAAASLKPKHVERLVQRWQAEGLAMGTIKNRMAELRWRTEKSANRTAARA